MYDNYDPTQPEDQPRDDPGKHGGRRRSSEPEEQHLHDPFGDPERGGHGFDQHGDDDHEVKFHTGLPSSAAPSPARGVMMNEPNQALIINDEEVPGELKLPVDEVFGDLIRVQENLRREIVRYATVHQLEKRLDDETTRTRYEEAFEKILNQVPRWEQVDESIKARMPPPPMAEPDVSKRPLEDQYSWDFAIVLRVGKDGKMVKIKIKTSHPGDPPKFEWRERAEHTWSIYEGARITRALHFAGLKTFLYKSVQDDEWILLVGAPESRLREEAERVQYRCLLDGEITMEFGKLLDFDLAKNAEKPNIRALFHGLYARYTQLDQKDFSLLAQNVDHARVKYLQSRFYLTNDREHFRPDTPFSTVARLKLTLSIISAENLLGGANLKLRGMTKQTPRVVLAFFPLHQDEHRARLKTKITWLSVFKLPSDSIKEYFGEQIGYYFEFLSQYTKWLVFPAFFGLIIFIVQIAQNEIMHKGTPVFGVFMALWATVFLEFWKRRQSEVCMRWGQTKFLQSETNRPEFEGDWELSPVTGKYEEVYPMWKKVLKVVLSQSVLVTLVLAVIAAVVGIVFFRLYLVQHWTNSSSGPALVASVANVIQIQIFNFIYGNVAARMNNFENHRTETAYENALIAKNFLFKFINSYQSLFYIAFAKKYDIGVRYCKGSYLYKAAAIKNVTERDLFNNIQPLLNGNCTLSPEGCGIIGFYKENPEYRGDCMYELAYNLAIVFGMQLVLNNALEIGFIWWGNRAAKKKETTHAEMRLRSPAEVDYSQWEYSGVLYDFDEIVVQFGYVVLFVVAFPLAPLIALGANLLEYKLDSYKLVEMTRRPSPSGAHDIGSWYYILGLLSWVALFTNIAIIIDSPSDFIPAQYPQVNRLLAFILTEHALLLLKMAVQWLVPDQPDWVDKQIHREEVLDEVYLR